MYLGIQNTYSPIALEKQLQFVFLLRDTVPWAGLREISSTLQIAEECGNLD